jgi:hypothetical protein
VGGRTSSKKKQMCKSWREVNGSGDTSGGNFRGQGEAESKREMDVEAHTGVPDRRNGWWSSEENEEK